MSKDHIYDAVLAYITDHGETGVNVLAKSCDIPLSTMQRYLERQTYFRKTINRKWDIPDNVDTDIKSNTMTLMVESVETALKLLDSQFAEIRSSIQNALMPVSTLKRAVNTISLPVADKSVNIDKRLIDLDKKAKDGYAVIKLHIKNVPEEYKDIILNLDILGLMIEKGIEYLFSPAHEDLTQILTGNTDELSDETLKMLESYQKGA